MEFYPVSQLRKGLAKLASLLRRERLLSMLVGGGVAQGENCHQSRVCKVCFQSVNHVHEDCADRRDEGHDRGRETQPSDPAAGRQRLLHPCNTFFKRLADRRSVHAGRFLEQ
jgi:hypothetical protein